MAGDVGCLDYHDEHCTGCVIVALREKILKLEQLVRDRPVLYPTHFEQSNKLRLYDYYERCRKALEGY